MAGRERYDAVVVGASIAGSTAATLLARQGARVALVERSADEDAYKTVCTHFIQSSAMPTLERLGLGPELTAAGAVHTGGEMWTRWGWVRSPKDAAPPSLNLRREKLDPLLRRMATTTPGVDVLLGHTVEAVRRDGPRVTGVMARTRGGDQVELAAKVVVGADGRNSRVADLAGMRTRSRRHGRFVYYAYYRDVPVASAPRAQVWMLDPNVAYAFPCDDGLTLLAVFPVKEHLPAFKADLEGAFVRTIEELPEGPPIAGGQRVSPIMGKLDMPNLSRRAAGPGIALVGDAALASDPLWGVGCGWALQSAEWLADAVGPALAGGGDVDRALARYRRRHRRALRGHEFLNSDYATGRRFNPLERLLFSAAARDASFAAHVERYGTRNIAVHEFASPAALGRAVAINVRHRRGAARADERVPAGVA